MHVSLALTSTPHFSSPELALKSGDESKFAVLAPGQSFELTHDLAGVYNFTRSGAGEYKASTSAYIRNSGDLLFSSRIPTVRR